MESTIVLEMPEAEALVRELRLEGDPFAGLGVPAHVTLLYPFIAEPDEGILEELRFFFAGVDGFPVDFSSVGEFPEVVYLAPDQSDLIEGLIDALARRWPGYPRYGGVFGHVVPHLTVVATPDPALRARARATVEPGLPIHSAARVAGLWVRKEGSPWYRLARFPLGPLEP